MYFFLLCIFLAVMLPGEFFSLLGYGFYGISGKTRRHCIETQSCPHSLVLVQTGHQRAVLSFTRRAPLLPSAVGMSNHFESPVLRVRSVIIFWFIKRHSSADSPSPSSFRAKLSETLQARRATPAEYKVVIRKHAGGHMERNLLTGFGGKGPGQGEEGSGAGRHVSAESRESGSIQWGACMNLFP